MKKRLFGEDAGLLHYADKKRIETTPARWWVLVTFCFLSFIQSVVWFTFSAVPDVTKAYYTGMTDSTIDLLLNWGSILFLVVCPFVSYFIVRPNGFRLCFFFSAIVMFTATVVRLIPCWIPSLREHSSGIGLLHLAQILNGLGGPITMAAISHLSVMWFPDSERATATAIAFNSNAFGTGVSFFMDPNIATSVERFPYLLYTTMGLAAVPLLMGLIYFPNQPKYPPSLIAASYSIEEHQGPGFIASIRASFSDRTTALVLWAGGTVSGTMWSWQGVLSQMFSEERGLSNTIGGELGLATVVAGIVGGLSIGVLLDRIRKRQLKTVLVVLFVLIIGTLAAFTLMMRMPWGGPVLPNSFTWLLAGMLAVGLFQGATTPVFYEFAADVAYPAPEAVSGGSFIFLAQVFEMLYLVVQSKLPLPWANPIQVGVFTIGLLILLLVRPVYRRTDAEEREAVNSTIS